MSRLNIKNINFIALSIDKIVKLLLGVFVGALVARYLGAEKFGVLNYLISIVSIGTAISSFGLNDLIVRELSRGEIRSSIILPTVLLFRILVSLVVFFFLLVFVWYNDLDLSFFLISVILFSVVFASVDFLKLFFDVQRLSYLIVIIEVILFIISSIFKYLVVKEQLDTSWIFLIFSIESLILFTTTFLIYNRINPCNNWSINKSFLFGILIKSKPLFIASLASILYMKIDSILIFNLLDSTLAGNYMAGVKIVEIFNNIPIIAITVYGPILYSFSLDYKGRDNFKRLLSKLYFYLFWCAIFFIFSLVLFSDFIVKVLYKNTFIYASDVIKIYSLSLLSVFLGVASSSWFLSLGKTNIILMRTLLGLFFNLLLNYIFIPKYGVFGAAWATSISYFISVFSIVFFKGGGEHLVFMIKSFVICKYRQQEDI